MDSTTSSAMKLSPYTMFYRKLYELVLSRLDAICYRLVGQQWKDFEKLVWNLFLYLFVHQTERLFRSRDLDQILLSCIFYAAHSHVFLAEQRPTQFTWSRLIQAYKTIPNARPKILRSVFIRCEPPLDCAHHRTESGLPPSSISSVSCSDTAMDNPCLTPSKPAGTIHLIDGQWMGDITSFYKEIFLTTENLQSNLSSYFQTNPLIEFPRSKVFSRPSHEHLAIHVDSNTSINYSSCQINRNLFSSTNEENQLPKTDAHHKTLHSNILSSAIPAGLLFDHRFPDTLSFSVRCTQHRSNNENPNNRWQVSHYDFHDFHNQSIDGLDGESLEDLQRENLLFRSIIDAFSIEFHQENALRRFEFDFTDKPDQEGLTDRE